MGDIRSGHQPCTTAVDPIRLGGSVRHSLCSSVMLAPPSCRRDDHQEPRRENGGSSRSSDLAEFGREPNWSPRPRSSAAPVCICAFDRARCVAARGARQRSSIGPTPDIGVGGFGRVDVRASRPDSSGHLRKSCGTRYPCGMQTARRALDRSRRHALLHRQEPTSHAVRYFATSPAAA